MTLDPAAFRVASARVRDGIELAFVHEGIGGLPLLLVHGWPETKRIWWRNIAALAAAGFEVIAPDLRGFGDSGLAPDGAYDIAAHARDLHALVHDHLGHPWCVAAGGDLGGAAVYDLGLRFPGFVARQCVFNCPLPRLDEAYAAAGLAPRIALRTRMAADYYVRQGRDADALAAELDTPSKRRRYVEQFYGSRFWASPGTFTADDASFMAEPFTDAAKLRAGFGNYESAMGTRALSEPPRLFESNPLPTLVLYGPDDHVIYPDFAERCEVVFPNAIGPFVVPRAGHFLQWERAELFNGALTYFFQMARG